MYALFGKCVMDTFLCDLLLLFFTFYIWFSITLLTLTLIIGCWFLAFQGKEGRQGYPGPSGVAGAEGQPVRLPTISNPSSKLSFNHLFII